MTIELSAGFVFGFVLGLFIGAAISYFFAKKIEIEKLISLIVIFSWLGVHLYGFGSGMSVPLIFDVVGGASVGHLIGFDFIESLKKFRK